MAEVTTSWTPNKSRALRQRAASTARRTKASLADVVPVFVHADYAYWREIWRSIRHAMIGEVEIKRHGEAYLPRPESMDEGQWSAYLERAVFYNMVYRTVTGLTGAIFRRDPRLSNAKNKTKALAQRISKDNLSLTIFAKVIAQEMLSVGRYGVLLDKANTNEVTADPFLAGYTTENILDWTETEVDGRNEIDYVLLREFKVDRRFSIPSGKGMAPNPTYGQLFQKYRVLRLAFSETNQRWEYFQEVYERDNADADLTEVPTIVQPLVFGVPFKRIPFRFFNATTSLSEIEKPPVLDILTLNLSHYRTYAQLEHGRFFTANPVYYVSGGSEDDDYHIGPSVVWQIDSGQTAGLIEFNGQGLRSLESALEKKENQVASLGGRLLGESNNAGQSDNQVKLKDRNEQSLLLNVTTVINENFTELLQLLAEWLNETSEDLTFRVNQDFLLDNQGAREFRAVAMMYKDGQMPLDVIYEFFLKAEVIPEYVDLDTFRNLLEDPDQFPNNPDIIAKREGFADAKAKQAFEEAERQREFDEEQADEDRKSSEKVAKEQPKIAAVPGQATQANSVDKPAQAPPAPAKGKKPQ